MTSVNPDNSAAQDIGVSGNIAAKYDIIPDAAPEQGHILGHAADKTPQFRRIDLTDIGAVDGHHAAIRLVQSQHQFAEGRLAGTDRPDDANLLTLGDLHDMSFKARKFWPG